MLKFITLFTLLISNVSFAKYAHIRSRINTGAMLIFDRQEQQYISSDFCVKKDYLLDQIAEHGINLQDYQLNLLDELFIDSDKLSVLYCPDDNDPTCRFLDYYNYTQESVFVLAQ